MAGEEAQNLFSTVQTLQRRVNELQANHQQRESIQRVIDHQQQRQAEAFRSWMEHHSLQEEATAQEQKLEALQFEGVHCDACTFTIQF